MRIYAAGHEFDMRFDLRRPLHGVFVQPIWGILTILGPLTADGILAYKTASPILENYLSVVCYM